MLKSRGMNGSARWSIVKFQGLDTAMYQNVPLPFLTRPSNVLRGGGSSVYNQPGISGMIFLNVTVKQNDLFYCRQADRETDTDRQTDRQSDTESNTQTWEAFSHDTIAI